MVLAPPAGGVAVPPEQVRDRRAVLRDDARVARVSGRYLLDHPGGHGVVVASREQGGAKSLYQGFFAEYAVRPSLLRERFEDSQGTIVLDEILKVPALLDEVHWLIENRRLSFLLTGSSARKLRREHANLLGGRAWRRTMVPLTVQETEGFDLASAMVSGMLPPPIFYRPIRWRICAPT